MDTKQWTVSEITTYIKQMFELDSHLNRVSVMGEVSNLRVPGSGHAYFTLKDADSALRCVMWAAKHRQSSEFKNGDKVVASGAMSVYERDGQYQLYCDRVAPAGIGDLAAQFEALKTKLSAEGLFDRDSKAVQPELPHHIGIVTSPSTAALQDVLNVLKRRNPLLVPVLAPASVQGDHAPPQIIDALGRLQMYHVEHPLDAILVVRGGGSIEDLWCFNDEKLARMIAEIAEYIPVITGVGHEIDFTLADFAASVRAPTPSAAAELVTPITMEERREQVSDLASRAYDVADNALADARFYIEQLGISLKRQSPLGEIQNARQYLDALMHRAGIATRNGLALKRSQTATQTASLRGLDPSATLERGYSILYTPAGHVIQRVTALQVGDTIAIQMADGTADATVNDIRSNNE